MNGKRYSRQRELIYEALRQTEQHPTAEMIYQWLKPANPSGHDVTGHEVVFHGICTKSKQLH